MMKKLLLIIILINTISYGQGVSSFASYSVYFKTNKFEISKKQQIEIDKFITANSANDSLYFDIKAYCDEKGNRESNQTLSENRAKAVYNYLRSINKKWKETLYKGCGIDTIQQIDSLQRYAKITLHRFLYCGTKINCSKTALDTISLYNEKWFKNVTPFFTVSDMIKGKMYAIDSNEKLLKTAGMISFELTSEALDADLYKSNKLISVCIPLKKGEKFDPEMKFWVEQKNKKGEKRWNNTSANIVFDKINNCYNVCFWCNNVLKKGQSNYAINIDKEMPENVYLSTFKEYNFTDVAISRGDFSAIIDTKDTKIFAFVNDEKINPDETYFTGKFIKNGKEKVLRIKLSNCIKSSYKKSDYFLQTKKSNYFIDEKEYNKKGFWAWVKRLFEKDDDN